MLDSQGSVMKEGLRKITPLEPDKVYGIELLRPLKLPAWKRDIRIVLKQA